MKKLLLPISLLYSLILLIRHKFYDWGLLKSRSFDIPNICVGNLNLGGTGKTPHSEYLIRLLSDKYKVAVLSRGYGRKTKGFILADENHTHNDIGDEPLQYFKKFNNIDVAVDENRCNGMRQMLQQATGHSISIQKTKLISTLNCPIICRLTVIFSIFIKMVMLHPAEDLCLCFES